MNVDRILENLYRRLLKEVAGSELAALTHRKRSYCLAVLYDAQRLKESLSDGVTDNLLETVQRSGSVKAYVKIVLPDQECNGAWMVGEMWGRGYGEILVDIAFALAPNNTLIMDRQVASPGAKSRWKKVTEKLKGTPLPPDCLTYHKGPGEEYLNASYTSPGDQAMLASMEKIHEMTVDELSDPDVTGLPPKVIENALVEAAFEFFNEELPIR